MSNQQGMPLVCAVCSICVTVMVVKDCTVIARVSAGCLDAQSSSSLGQRRGGALREDPPGPPRERDLLKPKSRPRGAKHRPSPKIHKNQSMGFPIRLLDVLEHMHAQLVP